MKLFTVGPAQMYEHTLLVRKNVVPYFRTEEFSELMKENTVLMRQLLGADIDSEILFLTASGSGAMEAAVMNCFSSSDKLLIVSGGTFGERFEEICQLHNIPFSAIKLKPDEALTECHLSKYNGQGYTALLVNHHETYTGQLYDLNMISEFCSKNNMYLVVDAISSFLCDLYNMSQSGVDITIVSSQKGLCLAPGLSMVALSNRIIENRVKKNICNSLYFNFNNYLINIKRGQTPFTPAVGICFELNDMLKSIVSEGIASRLNEVKERCDYFRAAIKELPISIPSFPLSNALTPIRFRKQVAMDCFSYLKNEKCLIVNPVGGELGKYTLRIAHIGDLQLGDYDILLSALKGYLKHIEEI